MCAQQTDSLNELRVLIFSEVRAMDKIFELRALNSPLTPSSDANRPKFP